MTFIELIEKFPTEKSVIDYYLKIRYPNGIACNRCGSVTVYQKTDRPKVFNCPDCNNTFSPFKGTIFEKSSTDLRKWFYAIHLFLNGKKGISGCQLQREIGVTYKTAWRMLQQIRIAMSNINQQEFFDTIVEIDETYIGGKPRKENDHGKKDDDDWKDHHHGKRRDGSKKRTDKTPVVGVVDRNNKKIYAKVAFPDKDGRKLTANQLMGILKDVCKPDGNNTVMTDEYVGYHQLESNNYVHMKINHKMLYADGDIHTNNIESFWSTLKRGVYGIYHHISVKYMQRYVNEFCFRYNNRDNNMFDMVLAQSVLY